MKRIVLILTLLITATAHAQNFNIYQYGKKTVLEFRETPKSLSVQDQFGNDLPLDRISETTYRLPKAVTNFTLTLNGTVHQIRDSVSAQAGSASITRKDYTPPAQTATPAASPTPSFSSPVAPVMVQVQTPNGPVNMLAYPAMATATPSTVAAPPPSASSAKSFSIKPSHKWLSDVINDWANQEGYEVFFETRDFEIRTKAERVIPGNDLLAALTIIGESYRDSDAPFQITPTAYKQIIVRPMIPQEQE